MSELIKNLRDQAIATITYEHEELELDLKGCSYKSVGCCRCAVGALMTEDELNGIIEDFNHRTVRALYHESPVGAEFVARLADEHGVTEEEVYRALRRLQRSYDNDPESFIYGFYEDEEDV